MRKILRRLSLVLLLLCGVAASASAQTLVSLSTPAGSIAVTAISATTAVNNATTLTIPAPAGGLYNYVCSLAYSLGQDATSTVSTNDVTTSTNFFSYALKFSLVATANLQGRVHTLWATTPGAGCPKSAVAGTATTFVGQAANLHATQTWYATYFQAP